MLVGNLKTDACNRTCTLTCCNLKVVELHIVHLVTLSTSQYEDIIISNLLLLVGKYEEVSVNLVELLALNIHTVDMQTMLQGCTTRASCQYDACLVDTNLLWIHDLVCRGILQHTILMNTRRMCEGILTNDSLIRLNWHIHQRAYHTACRIYLRGVDVSINSEIRVCLEDHCDFLKRGITCTLTNTIDCYLYLTRTTKHTCHGIGCCHTEVVMTVGRKD